MEPLGCCLAKTKSLDFLTGEQEKFNTISTASSEGHLKHVLYLSDGLKSPGRKVFLAYCACQFHFSLLCRKKKIFMKMTFCYMQQTCGALKCVFAMLNPGPSSEENSGGIKCVIHSHKGYECRLWGDVACPF